MTWWAWIVVGTSVCALIVGAVVVWFAVAFAMDVYGLEERLERQQRGEDWPTGLEGW